MKKPSPQVLKAAAGGTLAALVLTALVGVGSRGFRHVDMAHLPYLLSTLVATFTGGYRVAMWLQRPPTAMYARHILRLFTQPTLLIRSLGWLIPRSLGVMTGVHAFIWRRAALRGAAHGLIAWGCLATGAITFPLVFGWVHLVHPANQLDVYQLRIFGVAGPTFPTASATAFWVFHALAITSVLVILGVGLALARRVRDEGLAAVQQFGDDILPLLLLAAIAVTGLLMTVSSAWLAGLGYDGIAFLHLLSVCGTLLWLPFGKLFHVVQRPVGVGVKVHQDTAARGEAAACRRCGKAFASALQIQDLIVAEQQLGFDYAMPKTSTEHYQWICPACRRALLGLRQRALLPAAMSEER